MKDIFPIFYYSFDEVSESLFLRLPLAKNNFAKLGVTWVFSSYRADVRE
ncbi:MAG: hypothetical protein AB7H97_02770 [Pseudobdellovibrionaceae bacterium]